MAENDSSQRPPVRPPRRGRGMPPMPKMPRGDSFWINFGLSVLVLIALAAAYSYIAGSTAHAPETIPISQLASDIGAGKVSNISVNGDEVDVTYNDAAHTQKISKKEPDASLTQ